MAETRKEPLITINGVTLSEPQAMLVRVAVASFQANELSNPDGLGGDEHGRLQAKVYGNAGTEVLTIMGGGQHRN